MPFKSENQRKYMWAKHPDIARRWTKKYEPDIRKKVVKKRLKENNGNKHNESTA